MQSSGTKNKTLMKELPIFGGGQLLTTIHQLKVIRLIFKLEA